MSEELKEIAHRVLNQRERMATHAIRQALGFRLEEAHADNEKGLYYVIDTNKAEPEVNHPGEHVAGPLPLEDASSIRQILSAQAVLDFVDRGLLV